MHLFVNFKMDRMFKLSPCLQCFLLLFSLFLQTTFQSMFEGLARRYGGCDGPDCGHQWDGDIRGHVSFLSYQGLCRFSFDFLRRQGLFKFSFAFLFAIRSQKKVFFFTFFQKLSLSCS